MTNNNTINLKDDTPRPASPTPARPAPPSTVERAKRRADEIDRLYQAKRMAKPAPSPVPAPAPVPAEAPEPTVAPTVRADLQTIRRPVPQRFDYGLTVKIVISILALAGIVAIWFFVFRTPEPVVVSETDLPWSKITVAGGKAYYGQVVDDKADPVVIKNVYCDYNQALGIVSDPAASTTASEPPKLLKNCDAKNRTDGTLRLVRGAEMIIIANLDPDNPDSYLKAILQYENK